MAKLAEDPASLLEVTDHPDYARAVPTPDHFLPLLYVAGLAAAANGTADALVRGYAMGSLSMTCYGVGADLAPPTGDTEGAAELPHDVPPEQTNI